MQIELNKFQLVYYIQGCVSSAHGRDEIWDRVIQEFIPRLFNSEIDFLWWICYRDFWHNYLSSASGHPDWAAEKYLQGLAALNRNNRFKVTSRYKGKQKTQLCYRSCGKYHVVGGNPHLFLCDEYIKKVVPVELHEEEPHMEDRFVRDWKDLSLYDKTPQELLNTRKGFY